MKKQQKTIRTGNKSPKRNRHSKKEEIKFSIGDRVSVADMDHYLGKSMNGKGTVSKIKNDYIIVDMDRWDPPGKICFNPKQCRLLKKKKRRRIWIGTSPDGSCLDLKNTSWNSFSGSIKFIEVKKK